MLSSDEDHVPSKAYRLHSVLAKACSFIVHCPHLVSSLSDIIQILDPAEVVHQPGLVVFEYERTRITLLVAAQLVYTPWMSANSLVFSILIFFLCS